MEEPGCEPSQLQREERPFKCGQCQRSYRHAGSLVNHRRTHEVGLFTCLLCCKDFSNPMALKNHLRIHTEERRHRCPDCSRSFRIASQLATHRRSAHASHGLEGDSNFQQGQDSSSSDADVFPALEGGGAGTLLSNLEKYIAESVVPADFSQLEFPGKAEEGQEAPGLPAEERRYKCNQCDKAYKHAGSLTNHKQSHTLGVYQCAVCYKEFSNLMALKNHTRLHSEYRPYKCTLCSKAFRLPSELLSHQKAHEKGRWAGGAPSEGSEHSISEEDSIETSAKLDIYQPPPAACGEGAPCSLKDGAKSSGGERGNPDGELCVRCGGNFADEGELRNHKQARHQTGVYSCNVCCKHPTELASAEREEEDGTSEERPYRCGECGRTYRHRGSLVNHRHTHQTGVYQCSLCPKQYSNLMALRNHVRMHFRAARGKERSSYTCTGCRESFEEEAEFQQHQLWHELEAAGPVSGMSHICGCCGMILHDLGSLQSHALAHSGGEPGTGEGEVEPAGRRAYSCELCGKSYRHSGSLINHKQTHQTGDFECLLCAKRFSNVAALKSHLRGHQKTRKGRPGVEEEEEAGVVEAEPGDTPNGMMQQEGGGDAGHGGVESPRVEEERMLGDTKPVQSCNLQGGIVVNGRQHLKEEEARASPPSSPSPQPYQCEILDHKDSHQPGIYQCSLCPKEYSNLAALKSHFRGHATAQQPGAGAEERPFLCSLCGMIFPSEADLQRHHGLAHSREGEQREGGLEGGEDAAFPRLQQEAGGRPDERDGEEEMLLSHICGYCGQTFDDMASLEEHSLGHREEKEAALADTTIQRRLGLQPEPTEEQKSGLPPPDRRPYACGQCGKTYRHGGSLVNHKKTHQVGDYQCGICSRQYPNLSAYRNHLRNHPKCKLNGSRPAGSGDGAGKESELQYGRDGGEAATAPASDKQGPVGSEAEECKPHVCDVCGELCKGVAELEAHCSAQHPAEMVSVAKEEEEEGGGSGEEGSMSERPFCCEQCGRSYKHAGSLINHKQTHKTGLFRCAICQKLFYNLMALKNHNRIHFETKRYKCSQCPKAFRLQKQLASHQRVHRERKPALPERPYRCEQCGRTYRHAGSLLNHRKSHKTGHYCCPVCPRAYPNLMALKNHQRIHFEVKRHRCPDCGKAFKWQRQLVRHQLVHAQRRLRPGSRSSPGCPVMEGSTPVRRWRATRREQGSNHVDASGGHVAGGHIGTTSDGCVDGTSGSHIDSVSAGASGGHVDVGTQPPVGASLARTGPFQCPACPKQFPTPSALKNHGRVHTKKRFECSECGKAYRASRDLVQHLWRHQAEAGATPGANGFVDRRPYKCDRCERTYRHAGSLLHHKKVHTIGLYRCPACIKEFHNLLALTYHLRTHSDKKGRRCSGCGQVFRTSSRLASHSKACRGRARAGHAVTGGVQGPETGSCQDEGVIGSSAATAGQVS
uniref:Zinc finger protein 646 n=1 Tax=Pelusios castaneus TaxID=367368 RepID=A0A8C8SDQ9_9SAUR